MRICSGCNSTATVFTGALRGACRAARSARNAPAWNDGEPWRRARENHVRNGFALKHLAHENELSVFVAIADAVADHALAQRCGELRREIAHLIGVRQQNKIGLGLRDHLSQRDA